MSADDIQTLIICLACGGNYEIMDEASDFKTKSVRYRMMQCPWCTNGGMSRDQSRAWAEHQRERRESEKPTKS